MRIIGTSTFAGCTVNLTAGTISAITGAATITNAGNGWYRVSVTGTADSLLATCYVNLTDGSSITYTGNGVSGAFLYGAQAEAGAFATSYIPTVASTVTRAADIAVMTGTNFSSWYNQSEGTIVWNADTFSTSAANAAVNINSSAAANRIYGYFSATSAIGIVTVGSSEQVSFNSGALSGGPSGVTALAYSLNDFAQSTRGGVALTDNSGLLPTVSQMNIGTSHASIQSLNGRISSITYYPQRLANEQLQALTS